MGNLEQYDVRFDKNSNGILIKKDGKLINMIALPPKPGIYLIRLNTEFEFDFKGIVAIIRDEVCSINYGKSVIDIKLI